MKRLLVFLLLPWWVWIFFLPMILVVWMIIGMAYLLVAVVALIVAIIRAVVGHRQAAVAKAQVHASISPAGPVAVVAAVAAPPPPLPPPPLPPSPSPLRPPPTDLPMAQKRQIASRSYAALTEHEFIAAVHDLFGALGYPNATVVPRHGDAPPVMTMLDPGLEPVLARCVPFRSGSVVDVDVIQETLDLKGDYPGYRLVVVSLNPFTPPAHALATKHGASLYDLERVLDLTDRAGWLQTSG